MREKRRMVALILRCLFFYVLCKEEQYFMARSSKLESGFQDKLRDDLKEMFPGCMIFKMDQIQGIPDLLVLHKNKWASLECKKNAKLKKIKKIK